jgi:hypothetical protein
MNLFQHTGESKWGLASLMNFVAYDIINGTASALAVGGVTTAAYTIEIGTTLTDANLVILASTDGVSIMKTTSIASERLRVGNLLVTNETGVAGVIPAVAVVGVNSTAAEMTDYNAAGSDLAAYTIAAAVMSPSELITFIALNGAAVLQTAASGAEKTAVGNRLLSSSAGGAIPAETVVAINGTAAEFTDYNAAGADLAAYTVAAATVSPSELLTFIALNGAGVMQGGASAAEKLQVGDRLVAQSAGGSVPAVAVVGVNSTAAEMTDYNAAGSDLAANTIAAASMSPSELITFIALNGAGVMQTAASDAEKAAVAREILNALTLEVVFGLEADAFSYLTALGDDLEAQMATYISLHKRDAIDNWNAK